MMRRCLLLILSFALAAEVQADVPQLILAADQDGAQSYTLSMQILIMMTLLTLLPAAVLSTSAPVLS